MEVRVLTSCHVYALVADNVTEIGNRSREVISYFERNGAPYCPPAANPAEWMLEVIKPSADGSTQQDWHHTWRDSKEFVQVKEELRSIRSIAGHPSRKHTDVHASQHREFVASTWMQFQLVFVRTWNHFWRMPNYIWSKITLVTFAVCPS